MSHSACRGELPPFGSPVQMALGLRCLLANISMASHNFCYTGCYVSSTRLCCLLRKDLSRELLQDSSAPASEQSHADGSPRPSAPRRPFPNRTTAHARCASPGCVCCSLAAPCEEQDSQWAVLPPFTNPSDTVAHSLAVRPRRVSRSASRMGPSCLTCFHAKGDVK